MECPICFEICDNSYTILECKHYFHTECIIKNIFIGINNDLCPMCRNELGGELINTINVATISANEEVVKILENRIIFLNAENYSLSLVLKCVGIIVLLYMFFIFSIIVKIHK